MQYFSAILRLATMAQTGDEKLFAMNFERVADRYVRHGNIAQTRHFSARFAQEMRMTARA